MIAVIATVRAKEGHEQDLRRVLDTLVVETRREKGCIKYDLHVAQEDPAVYTFYERWSNQAALDAHLKTTHIARAMARAAEIADAPVVTVYNLVE